MEKYLRKIGNEMWFTEEDRDNLKLDYRIKDIIYSENSSFQKVIILDSYDFGRMLVLDGAIQTTALDGYIYNEMITHIPNVNQKMFLYKRWRLGQPEKWLS